jgi:NAD(P)-dependent dehydrogenase (short-subunit alcohol dehydrogenase family)
MEEAQRQLDVNLFGALRVCRAVLPIMRDQCGGYIVNIGSIGGLIAIPYQPLYSASKFALEGMTESLRLEVRPFGIRVVIVEPGDTKTEITQNRRLAVATLDRQVYRSLAAALKHTADDEQGGPGPEGVARLLWRIVNTPNPRLPYTAGPAFQRAAVFMKRLLPYSVIEYGGDGTTGWIEASTDAFPAFNRWRRGHPLAHGQQRLSTITSRKLISRTGPCRSQ